MGGTVGGRDGAWRRRGRKSRAVWCGAEGRRHPGRVARAGAVDAGLVFYIVFRGCQLCPSCSSWRSMIRVACACATASCRRLGPSLLLTLYATAFAAHAIHNRHFQQGRPFVRVCSTTRMSKAVMHVIVKPRVAVHSLCCRTRKQKQAVLKDDPECTASTSFT